MTDTPATDDHIVALRYMLVVLISTLSEKGLLSTDDIRQMFDRMHTVIDTAPPEYGDSTPIESTEAQRQATLATIAHLRRILDI